ncbi:hypothetical protein [Halocatena halophila]|uniref:hypothetical protein n=1 Tax=Halocatena halophila TaxID=2814576 RepID=UPI002ED5F171
MAATGEARIEATSSGSVAMLATAGTGTSGTITGTSSGGLTAIATSPQTMATTLEGRAVGSLTALDSGVSQTWHLSMSGGGAVADTILTIEARYPELVATASPDRAIPERDRVEGYLKRPFESDFPARQSGGVQDRGEFSYLVDLFGDIAEETNDTKNEVLAAGFVDLANGTSLDNIGSLLLLPRRTGETDPHYRIRLKSVARALTGGATVDQVRETIAILLECNVSDVHLTEPPDQPARFDLTIDGTIVEEASVTVDDVVEFVKQFRAGGVDVTLSVTGSFTYRSVEDFESGTDLGEKGYGEAGYSGRIL